MKIKKLIPAVLLIALSTFGFGQQQPSTSNVRQDAPAASNAPQSVKWDKTVYDFKNIEQGKPVSIAFEFTNISDVPFIISNVRTSCGCTATNYTKEPVLPKKKSTITVTYNAAKVGYFQKSITVYANTPEQSYLLEIKGTVDAKKQ